MSAQVGQSGETFAARRPARLERVDPVLRRLGAAAWSALPMLALAGLGSAVAVIAAIWIVGPQSAWLVPLVGLLGAPLVLAAVDAIHTHLFDEPTPPAAYGHRLVRTESLIALPTALAACSTFAAQAADATQGVYFSVIAVAGTLATAVAVLVVLVALPVAARRPEIRIRSILYVAAAATIRRPVPALAAMLVGIAIVWLGLTWFTGLLFIAIPVVVVLSVAAAWPTVAAMGVTVPPLTLSRAERDALSGHES